MSERRTSPNGERQSEEVRRVLTRNDLLSMAGAADLAVGIARQREALPRREEDEKPLFADALERQITLAENEEEGWAARSQAWDYAGVIVGFCEMIGFEIDKPYPAEVLHAKALQELADNSGGVGAARLDKDLTLGVFNRYHAARNLRLAGKYREALRLVTRSETDLYGTGAEPHMAHYLYEVGATFILAEQAAEFSDALREWDAYWDKTRAAGYSTRYLFEFVRGLAFWAENAADPRVRTQLDLALHRMRTGALADPEEDPGVQEASADPEDEPGVQELSVTLALAEYLAGRELTEETRAEAVQLGRRALDIADDVRGRWRVIARSRAPLARVFQRVYGDIARLADLLGESGAELGLRAALSAKQTGFAARIRAGRTLMNPSVEGLIEDIIAVEDQPDDEFVSSPQSRAQRLQRLRFELTEAVSPMLADTVLPSPADLTELIKMIGSRYALDFVELRDTLDDTSKLYRTLIRPGGAMSFERFTPDAGLISFFQQRRQRGDLARGVSRDAKVPDATRMERDTYVWPDWAELARAVLPKALVDDLQSPAAEPVELLISAHSWLSLLPWAALVVDSGGTRLVQRALVSQCPVLTCLSHPETPPVRGAALIRLVGRDEGGVDVAREREAWGLGYSTAGVPLNRGRIEGNSPPEEVPAGRLRAVLTQPGDWQFLHIACHGADHGGGLSQVLDIPGEKLWAGQALSLKWPTSVLMASCHVGQVVNDQDAEPLNFVMALLTGGARCVVAGIAAIDDRWTGEAASHMVRAIRSGTLRLDVALREAQLAAIKEGAPEAGWALLSAYVQ